ncbi:hypothetical protein YC2023_037633 [Brassica napus]
MSGFRHAGVSKIGVRSITCYRQIRRLRSCPAALNGGSETETNSETLASRICSSLQSSLSPALQKFQHQSLKCTDESSSEKKAISSLAGKPVHWHATLEEVPLGVPTIIIAHEFYDALPVHQLQFILKKQHEAIQKQQGQSYAPIEETDESLHVATSGGSHGHGEAVSNTSSYLRIWALSLAHSEISSVFYETMRRSSFSLGVQQCVDPDRWDHCFHIVGLLLVIETLSTFLPALRLHLVEFQNKFYAHFSFVLTGNEDD